MKISNTTLAITLMFFVLCIAVYFMMKKNGAKTVTEKFNESTNTNKAILNILTIDDYGDLNTTNLQELINNYQQNVVEELNIPNGITTTTIKTADIESSALDGKITITGSNIDLNSSKKVNINAAVAIEQEAPLMEMNGETTLTNLQIGSTSLDETDFQVLTGEKFFQLQNKGKKLALDMTGKSGDSDSSYSMRIGNTVMGGVMDNKNSQQLFKVVKLE